MKPDWKYFLSEERLGFWVRLPRTYGSRELSKNWDDQNAAFEFPSVVSSKHAGEDHCQTQAEYQNLVNQAIETIQKGECEKLVTSRIFPITEPKNDGELLVQQWLTLFPDAFIFVIHHPDFGVWIGASPELLIYRNNAILHSVALAGSKSIIDATPWGEKEQYEHEVVIKMIKETFEKQGVKEISTDATTELNFRKVKHLSTPIKGVYSGDFGALVQALYPTPALSGWPKEKAIHWLNLFEPFHRGLYGGVLNFSDGSEQWSMVILRCCHKTAAGWVGHVGGGVMQDSSPELEWQETEWKRQAFIFADDAH